MAKITYLINVNNRGRFLRDSIESLKNLKGSFRKEFIFVSNIASAESLEILKDSSKELPNTTILNLSLSSIQNSLSAGIFISGGEYIQFLDGADILEENSTLDLLNSIDKLGGEVAFGRTINHSKFSSNLDSKNEAFVIEKPFSRILRANTKIVSDFANSSSIVSRNLIETISKNDNEIYNNPMSMILRSSLRSDFIYCPSTISKFPKELALDNSKENLKILEEYKLRALKDIIYFDLENSEKYKNEILKAVNSIIWSRTKNKLAALTEILKIRFSTKNYSATDLPPIIDRALEKFF